MENGIGIVFDVQADGSFGPSRVEAENPAALPGCAYCWGPGALQTCGLHHCAGCTPFMQQYQGCTCGGAK